MEESGQLQASAALTPEKALWCALNRRLGGPQGGCRPFGKEKHHYLAAAGN